jgi:hypothetical protein
VLQLWRFETHDRMTGSRFHQDFVEPNGKQTVPQTAEQSQPAKKAKSAKKSVNNVKKKTPQGEKTKTNFLGTLSAWST